MEIKVLGIRVRVEVVVACLLIGMFLGGHVFCSCAKIDNVKVGIQKKKEGFQSLGAPVNYQMGNGVIGSWETRKQQKGPSLSWRKQHHETYKGTAVPLPEGQMFMWANNEFKPECCGSSVSSSAGCACITKAQIEYINQRGGNRTLCGGAGQF